MDVSVPVDKSRVTLVDITKRRVESWVDESGARLSEVVEVEVPGIKFNFFILKLRI